jgi:hypothetical protein
VDLKRAHSHQRGSAASAASLYALAVITLPSVEKGTTSFVRLPINAVIDGRAYVSSKVGR